MLDHPLQNQVIDLFHTSAMGYPWDARMTAQRLGRIYGAQLALAAVRPVPGLMEAFADGQLYTVEEAQDVWNGVVKEVIEMATEAFPAETLAVLRAEPLDSHQAGLALWGVGNGLPAADRCRAFAGAIEDFVAYAASCARDHPEAARDAARCLHRIYGNHLLSYVPTLNLYPQDSEARQAFEDKLAQF